jgi:hypothetical protein
MNCGDVVLLSFVLLVMLPPVVLVVFSVSLLLAGGCFWMVVRE